MPGGRKPRTFGVRFDAEGRIFITSRALRRKIEEQLSTRGTIEVYGPGGILETCPTGGGPKNPPKLNPMCACAITGSKSQPVERARRTRRGALPS